MTKTCSILYLMILSFMLVTPLSACSAKAGSGGVSFAEAHDAFETNLIVQNSDQDPIPTPPEGVFDLVYYETKVGKLAAYASSDPGDGQKHPLIIWVAGGWGYGIDDLAWSYADWENDQTGSAFREAGVLMMYPSFRGANGNPGYYESVFGEIDDLSAAYDYAASLPYVDADRIYLGGHSTGGTKVLLTAEYTDKFRAVFSFGPVDEIKHHNTSQFTFDANNKEEQRLRSPLHWLKDIKTPTFIIEGADGTAARVKNIEKNSKNENIHCYIVDGENHFNILAPITHLLAQKILADTGTESHFSLTAQELKDAMKMPQVASKPIMQPFNDSDLGLSMMLPIIWEMEVSYEDAMLIFASPYDEDNYWDTSNLFIEVYDLLEEITLADFEQELDYEGYQYQIKVTEINGREAFLGECIVHDDDGNTYFNKVAAFQRDDILFMFWFYTPEDYKDYADPLFEQIVSSVSLL